MEESYLTAAVVTEALGYACNNNGFVFAVNNHVWVGLNLIHLYGSTYLKNKYLQRMIQGNPIAVSYTHLQTLALGTEGDVSRSGSRTYQADAVSLMTLHGSKGLEFPVVFLSGVDKGILPLEAPGRTADPEEERRLFYVGITRAREELLLLTAGEPSAFLQDLPGAALFRGEAREQKQPYGGKQLSLFD